MQQGPALGGEPGVTGIKSTFFRTSPMDKKYQRKTDGGTRSRSEKIRRPFGRNTKAKFKIYTTGGEKTKPAPLKQLKARPRS